ncbi:MAG: hypothetical protein JXR70_15015 [Spirochaetales bacterium]|nr:hypothetical protein [Spirochaetales bacterium]
MSQCERLENCPFYLEKMADMPAMASVYKNQFCLKDFSQCARLMVLKQKGPEAVPLDLFPNQIERAKEILQE